jgi:outer membrane lipoprotein-sorting protein
MILRALFLSSIATFAMAASVNPPTLSVQQIVERNAAARGGLGAWQRIHSMTLAGKMDAGKQRKDGGQIANAAPKTRAAARAEALSLLHKKTIADDKVIQLPFEMSLARPVKLRLEVPFQGQTAVQVYDGKNGWKLRPFLGRREVQPYTPAESKIAASQQELDGMLIDHAVKGTSVVLDGAEAVEGRSTYKLKLTLKSGEIRHLWVDAQTFLDAKIEGTPRRWDGKMRTVATYFRDYKSVNGLMIAHRLETRIEGVPGSENIFVEKVALNPTLNDSVFAKPM